MPTKVIPVWLGLHRHLAVIHRSSVLPASQAGSSTSATLITLANQTGRPVLPTRKITGITRMPATAAAMIAAIIPAGFLPKTAPRFSEMTSPQMWFQCHGWPTPAQAVRVPAAIASRGQEMSRNSGDMSRVTRCITVPKCARLVSYPMGFDTRRL